MTELSADGIEKAYAPLRLALAELQRRIAANEDLGSVILPDTIEREPDSEWDTWERAVLARAFES